jgi:hypothetical protein
LPKSKESNKPSHGARDIYVDSGLTADDAAILRMKTPLHIEVMNVIEKRSLTPRQLEK